MSSEYPFIITTYLLPLLFIPPFNFWFLHRLFSFYPKEIPWVLFSVFFFFSLFWPDNVLISPLFWRILLPLCIILSLSVYSLIFHFQCWIIFHCNFWLVHSFLSFVVVVFSILKILFHFSGFHSFFWEVSCQFCYCFLKVMYPPAPIILPIYKET